MLSSQNIIHHDLQGHCAVPLHLDFPKKKTFYMMRNTHWNQLFTFNFCLIFMSVWANENTADTCQISHSSIEIKKKNGHLRHEEENLIDYSDLLTAFKPALKAGV